VESAATVAISTNPPSPPQVGGQQFPDLQEPSGLPNDPGESNF
jgi:hypothetical protein